MTTTIKSSYGTATAITATLAALANGSLRSALAVDNSVNLFLDAAVQAAFHLAPGTVTAGKVRIWVYGSIDGVIYSSNAPGTNASYTLETPNDLTLGAERSCDAYSNGTVQLFIPSIAALFNGILPEHWGVIIENASGVAFAASGHTLEYFGLQAQGV